MDSRRIQKVAEAYRHELAQMVLFEMDKSELYGVTITQVRITPDMRIARVYFDTQGGSVQADDIKKAFKELKSFFRKELAKRVKLRFTPNLEFFYDETRELAENVEILFHQLDEEKKKKCNWSA